MKYFINFDDFETYKNTFKNKVDEWNEEVYHVFKSCQEVEWVGLGHDSTIRAIYNQIEELEKVSNNLNKFLEFMGIVIDDYTDGVNEVNQKFQEINAMLDAERTKRSGGR